MAVPFEADKMHVPPWGPSVALNDTQVSVLAPEAHIAEKKAELNHSDIINQDARLLILESNLITIPQSIQINVFTCSHTHHAQKPVKVIV